MSRKFRSEGGEDPVRRRELLAGAAGLAGAALGISAGGRAHALSDPGGGIEDLLYGSPGAEAIPLATLRGATAQARAYFQTARYDRLTTALPHLIATAAATRDSADGDE